MNTNFVGIIKRIIAEQGMEILFNAVINARCFNLDVRKMSLRKKACDLCKAILEPMAGL
jgi:hypothetical protein